ncbi:hypothetical protein DID78_03690 [Candidatus Marinamargulisbacteria bacterium SCGC AG-343-D04]|nr:hypothetical protein DID78_03690 [Candidatus Marinamargulisbacteria bacterium SCGC AG-343-D04]
MAEIKDFRFELLMDAGNGAQKAGDILVKTFAKAGVYVFIEPIIPAEISPPKRTPHSLSGAVIRVSSDEISNIGSYSQFVLVEHEILLDRRCDDLEFDKDAVILMDFGNERRAKEAYENVSKRVLDAGLNLVPFSINDDSEAIIKELNGNGKNMYYLGLLSYFFTVDTSIVEIIIRETFKKLPAEKLEKNINLFHNGYSYASSLKQDRYEFPSLIDESEKVLLDGNTAMSLGIIDSGFKLFAGYPITPASTIMHNLARLLPAYGGTLHQAEDEISAIGTVIGSYFSGVPAITATSGPGLSLKQEFIGLSVSAEIPCVVINVQRGGPSTGLPTRTEQTDLFSAAFGSHGDSPKVVISVANVEDCFYVPHVARYIAEKCRLPVIILSDYMTSSSYRVLDKLTLNKMDDIETIQDFVLDRFFMKRLPDTIEMVKGNQDTPGQTGGMRRVTGLNTNEDGFVEYSSVSNQRSHEIRNQKVHHVKDALLEPESFGSQDGDILIVGWGSTRSVIEESVQKLSEKGLSVGGCHLKIVYPLAPMLKEVFSRYKFVVSIEVAYGDSMKYTPFATLLRSETLVDVRGLIAQATGRPLKPVQVVEKVESFLKENVNA